MRFRLIGNVLRGGENPDTVFAKLVFVQGAVRAVPGEAVQLPHDHMLPGLFVAVGDHPDKVDPLLHILQGGGGPVHVDGNNAVAMLLAVSNTVPELPLNGLLVLPLGAVAQVPGYTDFAGFQNRGILGKLLDLLWCQHGQVYLQFWVKHLTILSGCATLKEQNIPIVRNGGFCIG